ncbi:PaaI family thioesterase [Ramlibacter sp. AN1015]|uniref:PaaI family thioesterase n=1 Tax=Ramlibacter sp. AN1015 TaxID=3133428 RepID=UPI0030C498DE
MQDIPFGVPIPFVDHLGFRLKVFEGGHSRIDFDTRPEHMNSFEVVHGGAVMTLLDVGMATAARSVQPEMGIVTIEMKTTFMRPSTGVLVCHGKLLHRTASMAFVEATVLDASERMCAHATGTFRYVRRQPAADGQGGAAGVLPTD